MKKTFLLIIGLLIMINIVYSQPPVPKNVDGRVFYPDLTGVENGIPVRILNLANSAEVNTEVNAPPIPQFAGSYSATITGNTGDSIIVRSWNATHYGEANTTLQSGTTTVDVILNLSRPSELNVTIILPPPDSVYNISILFNISANVTNIGGQQGTGCDAQISFSNSSVLNVSGSDTNSLGVINVGETITTNFTVFGVGLSSTNVTINASCNSDTIIFERVNNDTLSNITIIDEIPPNITLLFPGNNTQPASGNLTFIYNVSDGSPIANCSLFLNDTLNQTNTSISRFTNQTFTTLVSPSNFLWFVNCTDSSGNIGTSSVFNFTAINVVPPVIINVTPEQNIILTAGSTRNSECNVTVEDPNGFGDIVNVNATFFFSGNASGDPDDNNVHYTNTSCTQVAASGVQANYSCRYDLLYYAVNGTWVCNSTVIDSTNLINISSGNGSIDSLFALNTSIDLIDYGDVPIGNVSSEVLVNVSNIGNQDINITVRGYGENEGDGWALVCLDNNITIGNERFSQSSGPYASKTPLTSSFQEIGYNLPKQTSPSEIIENTSYWQINVPVLDPRLGRGQCNGSIVFQANQIS